MPEKKTETTKIVIEQPDIQSVRLTLEFPDGLLVNRLPEPDDMDLPGGEKAAQKEQGAEVDSKEEEEKKKKALTPHEQYLAARYMKDKTTHGFPVASIKKAMIDAVSILKDAGLTKLWPKHAKSMFSVRSVDGHPLMTLDFKTVSHDKRTARNRSGSPVQTNRALYHGASCEFELRFNARLISLKSIMAILAMAREIGLGSLRKQCNGDYGSFEIHEAGAKRKRKVG